MFWQKTKIFFQCQPFFARVIFWIVIAATVATLAGYLSGEVFCRLGI